MSEWRAHVSQDYEAFTHDARRVIIHRRMGEGGEVIIGFDEHGYAVVEQSDPNTVSDFRGFAVPLEALESLAEVLKPGPSQGEVKRLEEALAVERERYAELRAWALDLFRMTCETVASVRTPL